MIKFNDTNIIVGYIKQLLHSFNLPKYKVYTKEQEKFHENYLNSYKNNLVLQDEIKALEEEISELKRINSNLSPENDAEQIKTNNKQIEELENNINETKKLIIEPEKNILVSSYRQQALDYDTYKIDETNKYPWHMRYIPYIKDNKIQIYAPTAYIEKTELDNSSDISTKIAYSNNDWKPYHGAFEKPHEKLHGKEERFMPVNYVYNLKIKNGTKNLVINNNVYDSYTHEYLGDFLRFHRDYSNINLMPLYNCFSNRTCPNLDITFDVTPDYKAIFKTRDTDYKIYMIPIKFFQKYTIAIDCNEAVEVFCGLYGQYQYNEAYNSIIKDTYYCFNTLSFNNPQLFDPTEKLLPYLDPNHALELAQHEEDLKLFIKVPSQNKSAIVILEGDYRDSQMPNMTSSYNFLQPTNKMTAPQITFNKTVLNFDENINDIKLITPLQLLYLNTGESYPFADRLIEYLVGNAITSLDTLGDNIKRVKTTVVRQAGKDSGIIADYLWDDKLRLYLYNYIMKLSEETGKMPHDILGYVDRFTETNYAYVEKTITDAANKKKKITRSISGINIYDEKEWED